MDRLPVYILAGGKSRRFGSDKASALLDGKPLILHVADALRPFASSITVVADVAGKYDDMGLRTISDAEPGLGPLGGLRAALNDCHEPWLLLAPCDFAGIRAQWIGALMDRVDRRVNAVVFKGDVWQPLPGLYGRSIVADVHDQLEGSDHSLHSLLIACDAVAVPTPAGWPKRPGINSPRELQDFSSQKIQD